MPTAHKSFRSPDVPHAAASLICQAYISCASTVTTKGMRIAPAITTSFFLIYAFPLQVSSRRRPRMSRLCQASRFDPRDPAEPGGRYRSTRPVPGRGVGIGRWIQRSGWCIRKRPSGFQTRLKRLKRTPNRVCLKDRRRRKMFGT